MEESGEADRLYVMRKLVRNGEASCCLSRPIMGRAVRKLPAKVSSRPCGEMSQLYTHETLSHEFTILALYASTAYSVVSLFFATLLATSTRLHASCGPNTKSGFLRQQLICRIDRITLGFTPNPDGDKEITQQDEVRMSPMQEATDKSKYLYYRVLSSFPCEADMLSARQIMYTRICIHAQRYM